ncbi:MAG: hypothetical protein HYX78_02545 [Armatimonadetes bacterium]|nr:hypothetical protein [Armatimonadota bacterium]
MLLGVKPFATLPTSFAPCPTGRAEGNLATVIADHPITQAIPNDGYCDWQFYSMLTGGSAVVFNDTELPFDPIIDVVSSFKYIRKQSNLFELGVGRGRLLVCTMNLNLSDPASICMLDSILMYASGDTFAPKHTVTASKFASLISSDFGEMSIHETDITNDPRVKQEK